MRTKLIYLTTDPMAGGGPKHILDLIGGVDKGLFDIFVVAPKGWLIKNVKAHPTSPRLRGARRSKIIIEPIELQGESREQKIGELKGILRDIKGEGYPFAPVILHAQSPQAVYIASQAILSQGVYLVYTEHLWTKDYHTTSWLRDQVQLIGLKKALKQSSKVIAVSEAVSHFLIQKRIIPREKIKVIYPVLKKVQSSPHFAAATRGKNVKAQINKAKIINPKRPIFDAVKIGSIGSLNATKGYRYLVEAARILKAQDINFKIELIGDGPDRQELKEMITDYQLRDYFKLIGSVESGDLRKYFVNWDIYVQPSLSETFGLAVSEALSSGLPVVASRVGGLPEQVENGVNGLLIKPADPQALAKALSALIYDDKLRKSLAFEAGKTIRKPEFDWQANLTAINNLYQGVIGHENK